MDFLKKIFGGNTTNTSSANQENFVVDETGNAKEADSISAEPIAPMTSVQNSAKVPDNVLNSASASVSESTPTPSSEAVASEKPVTETTTQSDGEYVGDTSAFDELMKQAESSVDARVLDQPILDPEFQKAKDELESEGNIEIFPTE